MNESAPPSQSQDLWAWFAGATGGYLFDFDEDMYTLQIGAKSPWSFSNWNVSLFGEVGWTENHDNALRPPILGGTAESTLDIVPLTFNVKFDCPISGGLSAYVGGGLGASYVDAEISSTLLPAFDESGNDWVFTGQVFAGLDYRVDETWDVFAGLRWIYFDDPDFNGVSLGGDLLIEGGLRLKF